MNQILVPETLILIDNDYKKNTSKFKKKNKKRNNFYIYQFLFFFTVSFCFIFIFFIRMFNFYKNESISQKLKQSYQLSTLYLNPTNYSLKHTTYPNQSYYYNNLNNTPFVIGMIQIDKINLNYPILSQSNKELLKISLCKFAGPMPNEPGNLCIAGHNYINNNFFGRLDELNKNDIIKIYDLNGSLKKYSIFKIYETNSNDISCKSQYTNGKTIITLLTCNNVTGKRLVVVANALDLN